MEAASAGIVGSFCAGWESTGAIGVSGAQPMQDGQVAVAGATAVNG